MKHGWPLILRCAAAVAVLAAVVAVAGCSTTRRLPEGEHLYTGIKSIDFLTDSAVRIPSAVKTEIREAAFVAPNNYWALTGWHYPFPLGLWVYNNWPNPPSGIRHWLYNKLVENPVLLSDVRPEVRTRMIDEILQNNGFFGARTSYALIPGRNPRKTSVAYTVHTGRPYRFSAIELLPDSTPVNRLIDSLARRQTYLRPGNVYNADSLAEMRVRIANGLRNRGYYYFRPEFLEYLADSVATRGQIALRLNLASNLPRVFAQPYTTGKVRVTVLRNDDQAVRTDTVQLPKALLIKQMPSKLRNSVITDNVTFRPGRTFSVMDMNRTQNFLSRLGIFSSVSIEAVPDTANRSARVLDVDVTCVLDRPLEASIEVNASSKSNSYIGPGVILGVTNRNIFGGGEQLSVRLNGSYEWQTGSSNRGGIFNSYEAGITGTLAFPRLLAPRFIPRRRRQINWTRFSLNADLLNRPHFFKMAQFNMSMSYDWQNHRYSTMSFTPFKLTYTKLMHTTSSFDSIMHANPAIALSFASRFIPQMQYTYTLDRPVGANNAISFTVTAQQAGNLFWGIYELAGRHGEKSLFGTPFSQFVKGQTQLVYSRRVGPGSWLVLRGAVGAAHAYGNSTTVPYAEQFYCGGANSVRAFTVRSLGPGSYHAPHNTSADYFDQTGTFKFEANAEWRFPLMGPLNGAVFLDSGNVWLLKPDPSRPGGLLRASSFLRDLALGTGVGLRFDISMLVLRGDLGIGIHAPYDTGRSGYYNMPNFGSSLAFHLAIGYPF